MTEYENPMTPDSSGDDPIDDMFRAALTDRPIHASQAISEGEAWQSQLRRQSGEDRARTRQWWLGPVLAGCALLLVVVVTFSSVTGPEDTSPIIVGEQPTAEPTMQPTETAEASTPNESNQPNELAGGELNTTTDGAAANAEVAAAAFTPTPSPTPMPTVEPTALPTTAPTTVPTVEPTAAPTIEATAEPTAVPTTEPTAVPTTEPLATAPPTAVPTSEVSVAGTAVSTATATPVSITAAPLPTATAATIAPTATATAPPTATPSPTATAVTTVIVRPGTHGFDLECDLVDSSLGVPYDVDQDGTADRCGAPPIPFPGFPEISDCDADGFVPVRSSPTAGFTDMCVPSYESRVDHPETTPRFGVYLGMQVTCLADGSGCASNVAPEIGPQESMIQACDQFDFVYVPHDANGDGIFDSCRLGHLVWDVPAVWNVFGESYSVVARYQGKCLAGTPVVSSVTALGFADRCSFQIAPNGGTCAISVSATETTTMPNGNVEFEVVYLLCAVTATPPG